MAGGSWDGQAQDDGGGGADDPPSITRISPFNFLDPERQYLVLKAYFDGSGTDSPALLTLGGFSGPETAGEALGVEWREVLRDTRIPFWHTTDALQLSGVYKHRPGWDAMLAVSTFDRLLAVLMTHADHRLPRDKRLVGHVAEMPLAEYHHARVETPSLRQPEAICVNGCVGQVLATGDAPILLYFDQNEKFLRHIHRVWKKGRSDRRASQREWALRVENIAELSSQKYVELQAADLLAWLFTRSRALRISGVARSARIGIDHRVALLRSHTRPTHVFYDAERLQKYYSEEQEQRRKLGHLSAFGTKRQQRSGHYNG